jgi:carbon starvation protein CstA
MISESVIALIWAAIAMAFFYDGGGVATVLAQHDNSAAWAVNEISNATLGVVGGILAILGVVAAPITSGDTAFRSARLIAADMLNISQTGLTKRILVSLPLFLLGLFIIFALPFQTIWSYFAWMNQTLAAITLWCITVYLAKHKKPVAIGLLPAMFMTYVCSSYIFISPMMLGLTNRICAYILGGVLTIFVSVLVIMKNRNSTRALS